MQIQLLSAKLTKKKNWKTKYIRTFSSFSLIDDILNNFFFFLEITELYKTGFGLFGPLILFSFVYYIVPLLGIALWACYCNKKSNTDHKKFRKAFCLILHEKRGDKLRRYYADPL